MDPGHGRSLLLVLVAALSIGALVPHLARSPGGSLSPVTSELESKSSSSAQSDPLEITDLLAEHFQVDVSTNGLRKRVEAALADLSENTEKSSAAAVIVRALFCDGNVAAAGCDSPTATPKDVAAAIRAVKDFVSRPDSFDGFDKSALVRAVIREAAPGVPIRFLIATVPDPVDSYETWQFDPVVDGLRAAVQDNGYSFDRFVFPEVAADPRAQIAAQVDSHRRFPGVVLFGRRPPPTDGGEPSEELLALFLVPETPTTGIHHEPFQRAVKFISAWIGEEGNRKSSLAGIIGPSFSGSSRSLARVLRSSASSLERLGQPTIRVISGNASNFSNKCIIERALDGQNSTGLTLVFRSTVHPNDGMNEAVEELQKHIGMTGRLAEVSESSTSFGQDLRDPRDEEIPSATDPCKPPTRQSEGSLSASAPTPPDSKSEKPLQITVPYNVAQLRAGGGRARGSVSLDAVLPTVRPLPLEDFVSPTDQPTVRMPGTMAAYTEQVLRNLIDTIKRENVRAVKIATTDVRDRLYLARELAQRAPDLMVFALDADLFYGHPEQYSWTDGLIVVSSYPLHTIGQLALAENGANPAPKQFPNLASQGLYNATVAALNYREDGTQIVKGLAALVDYTPMRCPGTEAIGVPPVWISVVGRGALVPVKTVPLCSSQQMSVLYMFPAQQDLSGYWESSKRARLSPSTIILLISIAVAAGAVAFAGLRYLSGRSVAISGGVVLAALLIVVLAIAWGHPTATVALIVLLVSVAPVMIVHPFRPSALIWYPEPTSTETGHPAGPSTATSRHTTRWGFLPIVMLCAAVWISLVGYLSGLRGASVIELWTLLDIDSGASPLVTMLLVAAVPLIVSGVEMRRQLLYGFIPGDAEVLEDTQKDTQKGTRKDKTRGTWRKRGVELLDRFLLGGLNKRDASELAALHRRSLYLPWRLWGIVAVTTAISVLAVFDLSAAPVWSANGVRFGWVIFIGILVVQALLGLALLQFITEWQICARLLRGLAMHSLAPAFPDVPKEILPKSLFPRRFRLETLKVLLDQMRECGLPTDEGEESLVKDLKRKIRPRWLASGAWKKSICPHVATLEIPRTGVRTQREKSVVTFLATAAVMIVRELMSRLTLSLMMIGSCLAVLIGINATVSFQGSHRLLGLVWIDVIVAIAIVMWAFIQMDRDETLSLVSNTTPGQVDLNIDLLAKVGVYVVLPMLVLFISQFPGIGSSLRDVLGSVPAFKE